MVERIKQLIEDLKRELEGYNPANMTPDKISRWGRMTAALHSLEELLTLYPAEPEENKG